MPRAPMHRQGSCCRPARHACVHKLLPGCAGRWRPGWQAVCLPRGRGPTCADGSQKDDSRATDRRLDERDAARGAAWLQQEAGQQRGASKAGEALEEASKPPPGQRRRQLLLLREGPRAGASAALACGTRAAPHNCAPTRSAPPAASAPGGSCPAGRQPPLQTSKEGKEGWVVCGSSWHSQAVNAAMHAAASAQGQRAGEAQRACRGTVGVGHEG